MARCVVCAPGLYNLLLSPHPDDLVFSAFSILTKKENNLALVFFNVSSFTRWPVKSKKLVTGYRTLEDRAILRSLKTKVKYLNLEDNSLKKSAEIGLLSNQKFEPELPAKIYSPLGVGGSPNHLQVRDWAVNRWIGWERKTELFFYEDLPYAAKSDDLEQEEGRIIRELEKTCGPMQKLAEPLTATQLDCKLRKCRAYFSQTDYSKLIGNHAKNLANSSTKFAEIFYRAG
jgi:hypothetical protein